MTRVLNHQHPESLLGHHTLRSGANAKGFPNRFVDKPPVKGHHRVRDVFSGGRGKEVRFGNYQTMYNVDMSNSQSLPQADSRIKPQIHPKDQFQAPVLSEESSPVSLPKASENVKASGKENRSVQAGNNDDVRPEELSLAKLLDANKLYKTNDEHNVAAIEAFIDESGLDKETKNTYKSIVDAQYSGFLHYKQFAKEKPKANAFQTKVSAYAVTDSRPKKPEKKRASAQRLRKNAAHRKARNHQNSKNRKGRRESLQNRIRSTESTYKSKPLPSLDFKAAQKVPSSQGQQPVAQLQGPNPQARQVRQEESGPVQANTINPSSLSSSDNIPQNVGNANIIREINESQGIKLEFNPQNIGSRESIELKEEAPALSRIRVLEESPENVFTLNEGNSAKTAINSESFKTTNGKGEEVHETYTDYLYTNKDEPPIKLLTVETTKKRKKGWGWISKTEEYTEIAYFHKNMATGDRTEINQRTYEKMEAENRKREKEISQNNEVEQNDKDTPKDFSPFVLEDAVGTKIGFLPGETGLKIYTRDISGEQKDFYLDSQKEGKDFLENLFKKNMEKVSYNFKDKRFLLTLGDLEIRIKHNSLKILKNSELILETKTNNAMREIYHNLNETSHKHTFFREKRTQDHIPQRSATFSGFREGVAHALQERKRRLTNAFKPRAKTFSEHEIEMMPINSVKRGGNINKKVETKDETVNAPREIRDIEKEVSPILDDPNKKEDLLELFKELEEKDKKYFTEDKLGTYWNKTYIDLKRELIPPEDHASQPAGADSDE